MKTQKSNLIHCFSALLIVILLMTSFMAVGYSAISQKSEANATSPSIYYFTDCEESADCINNANSSLSYSITTKSFYDESTFMSLYEGDYFYLLDDYDYIIFESRYHSFANSANQLTQLFYNWKMQGTKIMFIYGFAPARISNDAFLDYVDIFITTDVFTHRIKSLLIQANIDFSTNNTENCVLSNSTWIINEGVELMPYCAFDRSAGISYWLNFSEHFFRPYLLERYGWYIPDKTAPLQEILSQLNIELYLYDNDTDGYYGFNNWIYNDLNLNGRNLITFWSTYDRAYGAKYPILDIDYIDPNNYANLAESANGALNFCSYMYNDFYFDSNIPIYRNGITLYEFDEDLTEMIFAFLNNQPLDEYDNIYSRCIVTHLMTRFDYSEDALPFYTYEGEWDFWNIG